MLLDEHQYEGSLDFKFLCKIHRVLFQDLFDWAGEPRTVGLAKRDIDGPDGKIISFTPATLISHEAVRLFASLPSAEALAAKTPDAFAAVIGSFLVSLNNLHPFREGNGRTQRLFVRHLGRRAGLDVAWDVVTRERMIEVSVQGAIGNLEPMCRLLLEIIDSDRVFALRKALNLLKKYPSISWNDLYVATTVSGQAYSGVLVGRTTSDFMMRAKGNGEEWIAVGHIDDIPKDAVSGDPLSFTSRRW